MYKDLITNKEVSESIRDTYSYVLRLRERIITSCNLAQKALQISGQKSRDHANRNRKLIKFMPNEKVLNPASRKIKQTIDIMAGSFHY